ncbi:hypothetical protein ACS0TY_036148 [Phlomoides rotata]
MSDGGPKLFANKPKKSKLKASTPITTVSPPSKGAAAPPPPTPKEPFFQRFRFPLPPALERFRFLVPFVLVVNFTIGAYTLVRVTMGKKRIDEDETPDRSAHFTSNPAAPTPTPTTTVAAAAAAASITQMPVSPPIMEPIQRAPIPEDQQRELFKWMLEERRKVKPKNAEEKKRIDEEKAILKQFIGAKSLPL